MTNTKKIKVRFQATRSVDMDCVKTIEIPSDLNPSEIDDAIELARDEIQDDDFTMDNWSWEIRHGDHQIIEEETKPDTSKLDNDTNSLCFTVQCVSECVNDLIREGDKGISNNWSEYHTNNGSMEVKERCSELAFLIEKAWNSKSQTVSDLIEGDAFDFEVVPFIVDEVMTKMSQTAVNQALIDYAKQAVK